MWREIPVTLRLVGSSSSGRVISKSQTIAPHFNFDFVESFHYILDTISKCIIHQEKYSLQYSQHF